MTIPPLLHPGDRVALAAPARKVHPDEMAPAVELLSSWGLDVVIPEDLYASYNQFAGTDSLRASVLQQLLDDESIRAIFCARGGYGSVRIIDNIDFSGFSSSPKWVVGYSDVTVLHSHIAGICHCATLHATMPINIAPDTVTHPTPATATLRQMLFEGTCHYRFPNPDAPVNRPGECSAPVVGGNLSILYSLLGSASDVDTDGKILLIEDLDEYLYHVDRMMQALRRAGKLDRIKGLLVGALSDMHDNTVPFGETAEEIVMNAVKDYHYPVAFHLPFGHIGDQNRALPLGQEISIKITENEAIINI